MNQQSRFVCFLLSTACADWRRGRWLQAAARLGVSVFASAPLAEGGVLRNETLKARHPGHSRPFFAVLDMPVPSRCACRGKQSRV